MDCQTLFPETSLDAGRREKVSGENPLSADFADSADYKNKIKVRFKSVKSVQSADNMLT
jgi:hypothetical protein